jgi:hypothetical protein
MSVLANVPHHTFEFAAAVDGDDAARLVQRANI